MNTIKITAIASMLILAACASNNPYEGLRGQDCVDAGGVMKEKGSGHFSGITFPTCVPKGVSPRIS